MANFIYDTPDDWKTREGTDVNTVPPSEALLLEIYNKLYNAVSNGFGKQTIKSAVIPITSGGTDSIAFDAFAGKIPVALMGKKTGNSIFEVLNNTNTASYAITAADYNDQILLDNFQGTANSYAADFNFQQPLTGVGTSIAFTHATYSQVVLYYIDGSAITTLTGMVRFTTVDSVNTYTNSGIGAMGGVTPAIVMLGNAILLPTTTPPQFVIAGNDITLDASITVVAGDTLTIVPFQ